MTELPVGYLRAFPDQVTPERLQAVRTELGQIVDLDPAEVRSGFDLAERLQGVASAISDLVISRGSIETEDPRKSPEYDDETMAGLVPEVVSWNIVRRFEDPASQQGRMFTATPGGLYYPMLGVAEVKGLYVGSITRVIVPKDEDINRTLVDMLGYKAKNDLMASDLRGEKARHFYPFREPEKADDTASGYLKIMQELTADLLAVTE